MRIECEICNEEMDKYDESIKKEWKEEFFCCENCNTKKIKRTLFNESGAELNVDVEDYLG